MQVHHVVGFLSSRQALVFLIWFYALKMCIFFTLPILVDSISLLSPDLFSVFFFLFPYFFLIFPRCKLSRTPSSLLHDNRHSRKLGRAQDADPGVWALDAFKQLAAASWLQRPDFSIEPAQISVRCPPIIEPSQLGKQENGFDLLLKAEYTRLLYCTS